MALLQFAPGGEWTSSFVLETGVTLGDDRACYFFADKYFGSRRDLTRLTPTGVLLVNVLLTTGMVVSIVIEDSTIQVELSRAGPMELPDDLKRDRGIVPDELLRLLDP